MSDKPTKKITHEELVTLLMADEINGRNSAEFSLIKTKTVPTLNKKHRETKEPLAWFDVSKETEAYCMLKVIYENAVNNALVREGYQEKGEHNFVAESLPWGKWVQYSGEQYSKILIEHKGELYIRATFNLKIPPKVSYKDGSGKEIEKVELEGYLPPKKDELVAVRTFKVSSIREIHMNGRVYILKA